LSWCFSLCKPQQPHQAFCCSNVPCFSLFFSSERCNSSPVSVDVIAVPTTSYSHPCCAQTGPLLPVNSGCLVLYILYLFLFFCFTAVFVSSLLLFGASSIFGLRPAPPCSHTSFCMLSPATFHRIPVFFYPATISSCIPQNTMCSSATFLTLLSLLPFDAAFCSTTQHLAYGLALVFVRIPATISFSLCLFAVNCSARHLYRAFSMTFWIASFSLSTAQMFLHCWAFRLASNHPHVLRVVAEFLTAISPRPRGRFTATWHLPLTQLAWRKDRSVSAARLAVWFSTSFAYHEPTRGRVPVQLCAELVVFLDPISARGHLTALISAFNIQVEPPSQHLFRCNIVWAHATTSNVI